MLLIQVRELVQRLDRRLEAACLDPGERRGAEVCLKPEVFTEEALLSCSMTLMAGSMLLESWEK